MQSQRKEIAPKAVSFSTEGNTDQPNCLECTLSSNGSFISPSTCTHGRLSAAGKFILLVQFSQRWGGAGRGGAQRHVQVR
ncbi:hypothetical protein E2C01_028991 [Portunus trituberculatus]|uniref:Uncharacterized protein n=1 Tax=Portunus trituberculatus TaxID=210409 RepID=A0A5B7EQR8_PORTR|nr:hypothetical protein [Portunus trituberculatus]